MYKLAHINKKQIISASRKALMAADAHYFAWPIEQQEHFRATMNESSRVRIRQVLLSSLLGINCVSEEVDKVWNDISLPNMNILNWANLLTLGIGEDFVYLNETMAEGKSLLDFSTLYDYDYNDYLFQEQANRQEFSDYKGSDYYAYKHPSWVRLLIHEQFYYATFLSLATYLTDEIDSTGSDYIDQLIPHKFVDGKDNGRPEKGGFVWDMQIDAAGQEGQLNELKRRWYSYLQERWIALSKINCDSPSTVYTQNKDWDDDPHCFFIFKNATTLKKIRWRSFLSDCKPLVGDFSAVTEQLEKETIRAKSYLTETHQDIMNNFDPKVVNLHKKRKIIMSAEAMQDLKRIDSEDEST